MIDAIHTFSLRGRHNIDPEDFKVLMVMLIIFCILYGVMHKLFPDMDKKKRDTILQIAGAVLIAIGLCISWKMKEAL